MEAVAEKYHVFERSGFGKPPYRVVANYESKFAACPGAPVKPGSSCDYCGTGIMDVYEIKSADGKRFKVGCECVLKTGDFGLRREVNAFKRQAQHKRDDARIEQAFKVLDEKLEVRQLLEMTPHPGLSGNRLGYVNYCRQFAGRAGKVRAARMIEEAAR
jgi:hypothetical protein